MSAARSRRSTAMSPEAPIVVYCSLIVVAYCSPLIAAASGDHPAAANPDRNNYYQGIFNAEDANPQQYYTPTTAIVEAGSDAASCCGSSAAVTSVRNNERRTREIPLTNKMQLDKVKMLSACTTDITAVSLIEENDEGNPNIQYMPSCTRVKRCGGCCGSNLLSCQPTQVETLYFQVKISISNGTHLVFKEKKNVAVTQHVSCKCNCIIKHCKPSQIYNAKDCNCTCNNIEDQQKCNEERDLKTWDSDSCSCKCKKVEQDYCTTGSEFNNDTCGCEPTEDTVQELRTLNPYN